MDLLLLEMITFIGEERKKEKEGMDGIYSHLSIDHVQWHYKRGSRGVAHAA